MAKIYVDSSYKKFFLQLEEVVFISLPVFLWPRPQKYLNQKNKTLWFIWWETPFRISRKRVFPIENQWEKTPEGEKLVQVAFVSEGFYKGLPWTEENSICLLGKNEIYHCKPPVNSPFLPEEDE